METNHGLIHELGKAGEGCPVAFMDLMFPQCLHTHMRGINTHTRNKLYYHNDYVKYEMLWFCSVTDERELSSFFLATLSRIVLK